jgi:AcrR family transcriptional regulator
MKRIGRPRKNPKLPPTKERILTAAAAAFSKAGFSGVGLDEIAQELGLTRPSLLYHFGSKEELYRQVLSTRILALGTELAQATTTQDNVTRRIEAVVSGFVRFLEEDTHFAPLLLRDLMDGRGPSRNLLSTALVPLLDHVEEAVSKEQPDFSLPELGVREALLLLASSALVYGASPSFRDELWTRGSHNTMELARILFPNEPDTPER